MSDPIKELINTLSVKEDKVRKVALDEVLKLTQEKVDWINEYWDTIVEKLSSENSYQRTIGMFVISNLAISDNENLIDGILNKYLSLMEDEKFITSRQTIQTSWKVAIGKQSTSKTIVEHLMRMFTSNIHLKTHANLIRKDVVESVCQIYCHNSEGIDLNCLRLQIEKDCDQKEKQILYKIIDHVI